MNLSINKALGGTLLLLRYEVIYTRDGDIESDDLGSRAQRANDERADLFVSIHCNSAEPVDANGVEVYHYPGSSEKYGNR